MCAVRAAFEHTRMDFGELGNGFMTFPSVQSYAQGGKLVEEFLGGSPSPISFLVAGQFISRVSGGQTEVVMYSSLSVCMRMEELIKALYSRSHTFLSTYIQLEMKVHV